MHVCRCFFRSLVISSCCDLVRYDLFLQLVMSLCVYSVLCGYFVSSLFVCLSLLSPSFLYCIVVQFDHQFVSSLFVSFDISLFRYLVVSVLLSFVRPFVLSVFRCFFMSLVMSVFMYCALYFNHYVFIDVCLGGVLFLSFYSLFYMFVVYGRQFFIWLGRGFFICQFFRS